jgi:tight adherence protein B
MSRFGRAAAAVVTALLVGVAAAVPAWADEAKSVQVVAQDGRTITFLVYLDPNVAATPDASLSSKVVVSGVEVPATATPVLEDASANEAILVLDVSGSMRGEQLAAAKKAASDYVRTLPADVRIGLISFNDQVTAEVTPTTDKAAVIAAIEGLRAGKKTALYDGLIGGLDMADPDSGTRILVLSDGGDTASAATLEDVTSRAAADGIAIDVVALTPSVAHAEVLRGIAGDSGQFLLATDMAGLDKAFDEATGSFGGKVNVTSTIPADVNAQGKFAIVTVSVGDTPYTGTSQLPDTAELGAAGAPTATETGTATTTVSDEEVISKAASIWAPLMYALLAMLVIAVGAVALVSYRRQLRSRLRIEQVLWYSNAASGGMVTEARPVAVQGSLAETANTWMAEKSWYPAIDNKLDNAGLRMNVATWLFIRIGVTLALFLLLAILTGNLLVGLVLGGLVGWLVSGMWLNSKENASRKGFEEELPDFLLLIASALRTGLSFQQALDSTAHEGQGEVSRQVRRALTEVQMGATIEQALGRVAERMQSEDMKWTVAALAIQRDVGGNLSNILDTAAMTVKGRAELRREVRTLSAEGRLSGWVLASLPVGIFLYMLFANRTYISFFWTTTVGYVALGSLFILFILGFIWMRRLVKIEV